MASQCDGVIDQFLASMQQRNPVMTGREIHYARETLRALVRLAQTEQRLEVERDMQAAMRAASPEHRRGYPRPRSNAS